MRDVRTTDWSEEVSPFWGAVIETALTGAGLAGLFKAGWTTIKVRGGGAWLSGGKSGGTLLVVQGMLKKGHASARGCWANRALLRRAVQQRVLVPSRDKRSHRAALSPPAPARQGALVMPLMAQGFKWGTIKFQLITATKP